ncbi:MAG: hypothetical protein R2750_09805 [Bacteroidales bacterium]
MILIYTDKIANRVKYISPDDHELLNTEISLTTNRDEFAAFEGEIQLYKKNPLKDELFFRIRSVIVRTGESRTKDLTFISFNSLPAFFPFIIRQLYPSNMFTAAFTS